MTLLRRLATHLTLVLLVSACATPAVIPPSSLPTVGLGPWSGRLALRVDSEPPQAFSASFELSGNASAGSLELTGPLGASVALLRWTPATATLRSSRGTEQAANVDALIARATGVAVPAQALFDWLAGRDTPVAGWTVDLSQRTAGKLVARQTQGPAPAELRIVLQDPRE